MHLKISVTLLGKYLLCCVNTHVIPHASAVEKTRGPVGMLKKKKKEQEQEQIIAMPLFPQFSLVPA